MPRLITFALPNFSVRKSPESDIFTRKVAVAKGMRTMSALPDFSVKNFSDFL
jgi:hypothetical protein